MKLGDLPEERKGGLAYPMTLSPRRAKRDRTALNFIGGTNAS